MGYIKLIWELLHLRQNTKKSRKQIERIQNKKLRSIICYAYEHSEYYQRVFKEVGVTRDNIEVFPITQLPLMNKELLMEHFDELVTDPEIQQDILVKFDQESEDIKKTYRQNYHLVHSSGSTGIPRYYVYDESAWKQMLLGIIRGALWGMSIRQIGKLLLFRPRMLYIAATDGRYGGAMAVGDGIEGLKACQMHLDINTPLDQWRNAINTFVPNIIIGYPSAIKILAGLVEKGEIKGKFVRVITCGEPLSKGLRDYMELVFGTPIVNFYGASESLALGVETNPQDGMYLFDDLNYVEVVDGQMYITSLYNRIQPIIRYHLSDQLVMKQDLNANLCSFTKVETLLGRDEDLMWFQDDCRNVEFIHPLAVEGICVEGVIDYQFRQINRDAFEMLVEVEDGANTKNIHEELHTMMETILIKKKLTYVQFSIRFVEEITPNQTTGKKALIVSLNKTGERYDS